MAIPIIDIFAGPGGLGEGFCSLLDEDRKRIFKIALSIEKDKDAHTTLRLRSFYRQFEKDDVPKEYYQFLKGEITLEKLYSIYPLEAINASREAWRATLGESDEAAPSQEIDNRIKEAVANAPFWVLIGGPPCQAYSVVGRSRRREKILDENKDERVGLYKQYLRILAVHNPAVFVMENVKGMLSASTKQNSIFSKILSDLQNPVEAYISEFGFAELNCPGYKIYSLTTPASFDILGTPVFANKDFIIKAENYGIPQARHRVILLGVRNDLEIVPGVLKKSSEIPIKDVLTGLPPLRSGISKSTDSDTNWENTVNSIKARGVLSGLKKDVKDLIYSQLEQLGSPKLGTGANFIQSNKISVKYNPQWYLDHKIGGVCNHESRSHMPEDLLRYFFVSCYGKINKKSPKLADFPVALLPDHKNVNEGIEEKKFADRFRVQLADKPSKTITSHISKDGHYYIHYNPLQCRSFTVREAARIQTFPDNYFFCGGRTQQFQQVGNAVPPYLAFQLARIIYDIFLHS